MGDTVISGYRYELNASGHRLSVTEAEGRTVSYSYDDLYRLTEENINGGERTIAYTYDNVGNRLTKTDSVEGTTSYSYDDNDRLQSETLSQSGTVIDTTTYSYDDNGNLIEQVKNGTETTTYRWNDDNRLVAVTTAEGNAVTYDYDDSGIRVSSTVNGETTDYLIDKNRAYAQVLEEFTNDQLAASYVYGHDLISQERGAETDFYQVDSLGSTRVLTDELGAVTDGYDYDAFGNLIASSGSTENSYRYAGEQFDANLDNYYLRQRFYDQGVGRFTRRDTFEGRLLEPLSLHKYLYAHDNPINFTDPSGLTPLSDFVTQFRDTLLKGFYSGLPIFRVWQLFGSRAHDAIQEDISFKYPHVFIEYPIPGGFIDVLDESRGDLEVYEIKPVGGSLGNNQLNRYTTALPGAIRGTFPFAGIVKNPRQLPFGIDLTYYLDRPGLIVYEPDINQEGTALVSVTAITIALSSLLPNLYTQVAKSLAYKVALQRF